MADMTCPNDLDLSLGAAVTFDDNVWVIQAYQSLTSVLLHHRISGDSVVAPIEALSPVGDQESEPVGSADDKQIPRSPRRNRLPVECINRSLWMRHAYLACALIEQREIGQTPSGAAGVLPHPPKAFKRVEVVPTRGWEAMEATRAVVVLQGRVELVRPRHPAAIDPHHDLLAGFAAGCPHLRERGAPLLGRQGGHALRADLGRAVRHRPKDAEPHPAGHAAPRARRPARLTFETFFAGDGALAQRTGGQTRALGAAPPAAPGEGKAPPDRCLGVEPKALAPARSVLPGREVARARGEGRRGGSEPPGGTAVPSRVVWPTPRTRARPSWTPGGGAKPLASARPLPWEEREPGSRGSGATRRVRCGAHAHVTWGGRPGRGRSTRPGGPCWAKRWPPLRSAA